MLTTQILSEAEELCDDILIVNHGREVARGDLHALKLLSSGVYEVSLTFDAVPDGLEDELAALHPLRLVVSRTHRPVGAEGERAAACSRSSATCRRAGAFCSVEVGGASLEDVFVELTGKGGTSS